MLNTSISVKLYLACGENITFDDATEAGKGTAVYNAVWNGNDVKVVDYQSKDYYVPYDSICYAEITKTTSTKTVQDDTCVSGEESE